MSQKRIAKSTALLLILASLVQLGGACSAENPFCMKCKNGDTCEYCAKSFIDGKSCTVPASEIQNCVSYTKASTCRVCNFGYYKNSDGYCSLIFTPKCLVMDDNLMHCTACSGKILVSNGKCEGTAKCSTPKCSICGLSSGTEFCAMCENGYSLKKESDKVSCVQQTNSTTNCMALNPSDPNTCLMCQYNYTIANGACGLSANYTVTWNATASKIASLLFVFIVSLFL